MASARAVGRRCRANGGATAEREMPALTPDQDSRNRGAIIPDAMDPEAVELPGSAAERVLGRIQASAAQRSLVLSRTAAALEESAALADAVESSHRRRIAHRGSMRRERHHASPLRLSAAVWKIRCPEVMI